MNSVGPNHPYFIEVEYRMNDLKREAKMASLRKQTNHARPSFFKRLMLTMTTMMKTAQVEPQTLISDENLGQPILKRSTATVGKV